MVNYGRLKPVVCFPGDPLLSHSFPCSSARELIFMNYDNLGLAIQ